MNMLNPIDNQLSRSFSLEEAKIKALDEKLKSRENKEDLLKAARQFEGIFFRQLLSEMDKTIDRSGLISGGSGEEMFRGLLFDNISEMISSRPGGSGFGIAEAIYRQLENQLPKENQENSKASDETAKGDSK